MKGSRGVALMGFDAAPLPGGQQKGGGVGCPNSVSQTNFRKIHMQHI